MTRNKKQSKFLQEKGRKRKREIEERDRGIEWKRKRERGKRDGEDERVKSSKKSLYSDTVESFRKFIS